MSVLRQIPGLGDVEIGDDAQPATPIPEQIRVGHTTFRVVADQARCEEHDVCGLTDGDRRTILVKPTVPPDMMRQIILHELLHAALYASGFTFDDDTLEERVVAAMTGPLLAALRDNTELLGVLVGGGA